MELHPPPIEGENNVVSADEILHCESSIQKICVALGTRDIWQVSFDVLCLCRTIMLPLQSPDPGLFSSQMFCYVAMLLPYCGRSAVVLAGS